MDGRQCRGGGHREALEVGPCAYARLSQRRPFDVLADQVRRVGLGVGVHDPRHAERRDAARRRDLPGQPLAGPAVGAVAAQNLHRHPPGGPLTQVDDPLTAAAEAAEQPVRADLIRIARP
ncbi:hypothetical protein C1I98_35945 [Spongiactinospora gelatinilytica]|uniref:Uncharacterized protein n=1 Tax=Spongiactinospora gelatinilytica TaxID=2666298 RepID=A0A2W2EIA6_9ACTN|nr:hypothetical protein C1I98_35945 [Spongiactinospora gelatinilytica]